MMLWAGVIPGDPDLLPDAPRAESPVWLEKQRRCERAVRPRRLSLARLFDPDLWRVTLHTSLLMGGVRVDVSEHDVLVSDAADAAQAAAAAFLLLLNAGGLIGSVAFGALSERWGGRRGAATVGIVLGIAGGARLFVLFVGRRSAAGAGSSASGVGRLGDRAGLLVRAVSDRGARSRHRFLVSRRRWHRLASRLPDRRDAGRRARPSHRDVAVHRRRRRRR